MTSVVLADPDPERREGELFDLRSGGLDVRTAETLQDALQAVAEQCPHAIVLAAELCREITPARLGAALRAQPETAGVRLVLVSAIGSAVDTDGADAVLTRPTTAVDLVAAVVDGAEAAPAADTAAAASTEAEAEHA